jgi:2-(1,2-epoxy-1,2-dihydrophenyl)acetyl-CoA isomerase
MGDRWEMTEMAGSEALPALSTLGFTEDDSVAVLTLKRPQALNAFTTEMLEKLRRVLDHVAHSSTIRVLIVTGEGRAFSAGQDLKEHVNTGGAARIGNHLERHYNPVLDRFYHLDQPTIAAVNGVAAGAGMSLSLAADFRIAAESARFVQAFVHVGLVPDSGSTYLLPQLVGLPRALELALLGETIDAATALQYGIVNRVVPAADVMAESMSLARRLAAGPPVALGLIKRGLHRGPEKGFREALEYEAWLQAVAARTEDHEEGVQAFLEKRRPKFKGR